MRGGSGISIHLLNVGQNVIARRQGLLKMGGSASIVEDRPHVDPSRIRIRIFPNGICHSSIESKCSQCACGVRSPNGTCHLPRVKHGSKNAAVRNNPKPTLIKMRCTSVGSNSHDTALSISYGASV